MINTRSRPDGDTDHRPAAPAPGATTSGWPWTLFIPAAGLVFELVVVKAASDNPFALPDSTELGFWIWLALPFVLTGVLLGLSAGRSRLAAGLSVGLAVAISGAAVWGYLDARARPDASLILISGPLVQLAAAVLVGVAVLLLGRHPTVARRSLAS